MVKNSSQKPNFQNAETCMEASSYRVDSSLVKLRSLVKGGATIGGRFYLVC